MRMTSSPDSGSELGPRLAEVRERIKTAALEANRDPDEITLVGISKTHPIEALQRVIESGLKDLGENKVQEAEPKIGSIGRSAARWHLVGHLQSNKARRAVQLFDVIHSLDSAELAHRLNRICEEEQRAGLQVLIQVELGREETKSGVSEHEVEELARVVAESSRLELTGVMTLPPFFSDPELARPYFRQLRAIRDRLKSRGFFGDARGDLSMGMTNDFAVAISEGATIVRVGTAIFGEREKR